MNPFAKHFSTIKASDLVLLDADGYVVDGLSMNTMRVRRGHDIWPCLVNL
jgi:ribulose-5-phosphate 4-epimerase/fuculose-1-phosphate aldolase